MKAKKYFWFLFSLIILIPIGIFTKYYSGPGFSVINNRLGGFFYVTFGIILLGSIFVKKISVFTISLLVLILTIIVEITQLFSHPLLDYIRSFWIGKMVLGNSFSWLDIPWYILGAIVGYYWLKAITKKVV